MLRRGCPSERIRFQVLSALLRRRRPPEIAAVLEVSLATVYRVRQLYLQGGVLAVRDGRCSGARRKVTSAYLLCLARETEGRPILEEEGASNWTLQRLTLRMEDLTGVRLHFTWVWQLLRRMNFRWNRSRPVVRRCNPRRRWQWAALVRVLRRIQPGEVLLFVDEADIDLNPKTGFVWTRRGRQVEVETPGRNQKHHVAGALNVDTGKLVFVDLDTKASALFVVLLRKISRTYRYARRIHLILDNYSIHKSRVSRSALAALGGRIQLHFLPSYSPELNPIEHVWWILHNTITRCHRCQTLAQLLRAVRRFLNSHGPFHFRSPLPFAVRRAGLVFAKPK